MASTCSETFEQLAAELGQFGCDGANAVLNVRSPFALENWTMVVIELVMLVGVALSLRHAVRRQRDAGDPTGLAIWMAAIAYGVLLEPPLYFPQLFGLEGELGLIFVHNQFSIQFLFDRLPLYIAALYPAMAYLAYELVRTIGVFRKHGPLVSAITVGVVHHFFYEIFDHLGPQLRWWIWGLDAPTNNPALGSVPLSSMVVFGAGGVLALTFLVRMFVTRPVEQGRDLGLGSLVARSVATGVLVPVGLVIVGLPGTIFGYAEEPNLTLQAIGYTATLVVLSIIAVRAIATTLADDRITVEPSSYVLRHAGLYLGAITFLWLAALPQFLAAENGLTTDGTPTGSLPYAALCLVVSTLALAIAQGWLPRTTRPAATPTHDEQPAVPVPS